MPMKCIIGTKEYMTQIFTEDGTATPVTVVKVDPAVILDIKTPERDGYAAIQVASGTRKDSRISKALKGQFKDQGSFRTVREFRTEGSGAEFSKGGKLSIDQFEVGEKVSVSAVTKGKGFQGVVKRHGFAGGRRSHGQKHSEREPGSIGAGGVQRVLKGMRMAGRMGGDKVTVKNLTVVKIDPETQALFIKGAVPGRRGTLVSVSA